MPEVTKQTTVYFTREEWREVGRIADELERPQTKIVQFATRVFAHLYKQDPKGTIELARKLNQGQP